MAAALLDRHGVGTALATIDLVEIADRLWGWLESSVGRDAKVVVECLRIDGGIQVLSQCDLVMQRL